jgi:hypothetical protein
MHASLTAVPVLQAQSWLQDKDMISSEKSEGDVRPIVVDFRHVTSSIERFLDAKESVREWKPKPYVGYRCPDRRFNLAPVPLVFHKTAS